MMYLEHRTPALVFETYITRSQDLRHWELSAANPVLRAEGLDEGINASDPDIVECEGQTLLYFCVGDQLTWMNVKRVVYPGSAGRVPAVLVRHAGHPRPGDSRRPRQLGAGQ